MIINIRGTNGAGKSTLMREIMEAWGPTEPLIGPDGKEEAYLVKGVNAVVIGRYTTACGGCDTIKTQDESKARILKYAERGHDVLFEGILISTIFGPWLEFSRANGGMVWAFMDTPLNVCLARIQKRNGGKPVKEDQVKGKYDGMARIAAKAAAAGEKVRYIDHRNALMSFSMIRSTPSLPKVS